MTDTPSPLYQARAENVRLVTELHELREQLDRNRCRTMEIAAWTKRFRKARDRADGHKARVVELENAIVDWYAGDLDEDGLVAFIGSHKRLGSATAA